MSGENGKISVHAGAIVETVRSDQIKEAGPACGGNLRPPIDFLGGNEEVG